jgi:hypothetical protein
MTFLLNEDGMIATLEYMAGAYVPAVEALRVHTVQLTHTEREVRVRGLYQQVVVVRHQAVAVTNPVEAIARVCQYSEEGGSVSVIAIDDFSAITARRDVVQSARKLDSERSRHTADDTTGIR